MYKHIKIMLAFTGVWFFASLLNGLLCGSGIAYFSSASPAEAREDLLLSFLFSFLFSVVPVGLVWLVATIALLAGSKGQEWFRLILGTAFFCSLVVAIGFTCTIGKEFEGSRYFTGISIVISAIGSVLIFRKQLITQE